uniref:phage tail fiber C-terminal domain-containing protein n=1 Tax=Escherichia coli TaxID=562 RepID=UPI001FCE998E
RFSGPKTSIICSPMTSLKTSIKTITYLSDTGCLEIQGASLGWFPDTDGALITGLTFLDPKDATRVQGFFQHLQVRFGDGPWQDVKGLDEVGSDTGRTGE